MSQKELFYHLKDINKVAEMIVQELKGTKVLLLFGDLGAGKTTLTKHIIKTLGGDSNEVTSPTLIYSIYIIQSIIEYTILTYIELNLWKNYLMWGLRKL
ncbi:tRNA threonylcarbamoyladenosine biosynthesis protein TsaE [Rickettsiales endosymbiont of Trichoplax sp. H2]|nr:tRNA (adenosine(37)-N6)-threonylcarbamoyltransferase complex ATPase subunit type 1 TsaE [Rickettsiales endosymbiont of Trichoplax sp. H2]MSO13580.1 tRNA threonylcarbamoyladenosine biosynthesis protein TsaE [Rickettsiales endosymbiont of Trichoplax sp. H2]